MLRLPVAAALLAVAVATPGCTRTVFVPTTGGSGLPPIPSEPPGTVGPSEPPLVWIGGTLAGVSFDRMEVREALGQLVTIRRLGQGTTRFFRVQGGRWVQLGAGSNISGGGALCVETLNDGDTLLALRVFLGATCGPA